MSRLPSILTKAFLFVFLIATPPTSAFAYTAAQWHGWQQWIRNQAIVDRTYQDLNRNVGLNCKEWVRKVIRDASMGDVVIPQTLPNENGWYWASHRYVVGRSTTINYVRPGDILQMNWRLNSGATTPHTAIVLSVGTTGFTVVESNWSATNTVGTRYITFSEWRSKVPLWSVYSIL
jgi:hypothetical protein